MISDISADVQFQQHAWFTLVSGDLFGRSPCPPTPSPSLKSKNPAIINYRGEYAICLGAMTVLGVHNIKSYRWSLIHINQVIICFCVTNYYYNQAHKINIALEIY